MEYLTYLNTWISNISSEIDFWDNLLKSRGGSIGAEEIFALRISDSSPFMLNDEIEDTKVKFLDVGSGPFSNCGTISTKAEIEFSAVDPLAIIYQYLKQKYNIKSPIEPKSGIVENLSDYFEYNSYDIVHMSNALDHCFDPLEGIKQMLAICKVGGKVILRHNENEGEKAHYNGLHQWNIELRDGKFLIWNMDRQFNIGEEIKEYAVIEKALMEEEKTLDDIWIHNKFVIRKLNDFTLKKNLYRKDLTLTLLEEVCKLNIKMNKV